MNGSSFSEFCRSFGEDKSVKMDTKLQRYGLSEVVVSIWRVTRNQFGWVELAWSCNVSESNGPKFINDDKCGDMVGLKKS